MADYKMPSAYEPVESSASDNTGGVMADPVQICHECAGSSTSCHEHVQMLRDNVFALRKELQEVKEISDNCCKPALARVNELEADRDRLLEALQLAYEHLSCADCTPDDYEDCSRHPGLHVKANRAVTAALTGKKPC